MSTSGWCTLKKKQFASIADLNLTASPHFVTTTLFLRSKGKSSSFSAPHSNPFLLLLLFLPCFHEKFQLPLSEYWVAARQNHPSLKPQQCLSSWLPLLIQRGSQTSNNGNPNLPCVLTPLRCVPLAPQRYFSGKDRYSQDLGASGSSAEVRLFHGWYIKPSRIQSSLKSQTITQMSALLWFYAECFYVRCCLYVVLRISFVFFLSFFFFEPCLLFYRLGSTFLCSWLRIAFSCGSYLTRAGMSGVYCGACFMQDWSLNTEPSKCQASPLPTEQHPSLFPVDETENSIKLNYPAPYILRFLDNLKAWVN